MKHQIIETLLSFFGQGSMPCIDSRDAKPGDIFFALRGEQSDGNLYAEKALEAGCALAVVDRADVAKGDKYLLTDDVLGLLQALGHAHRKRFDVPVIGVTGTNGKTTTKELMQAVLSTTFSSTATPGNLNNHIGLPLSLLSFREPLDIAVVEMGANHRGEIAGLCKLAMPTHGLITNIGKAHLEGFGTVEDVARAKAELFEYLQQNQGTLFVNHDDARLPALAGTKNIITYGTDDSNHCSGRITRSFPELHLRFRVNRDFGKARRGMQADIETRLTGPYNFENIMSAITTGLYFGVQPGNIIRGIGGYVPANNRSQIIRTLNNLVVMDAYNANPTSMAAALDNFSRFEGEKTAVMLGDMLELGETSGEEHQEILKLAKSKGFGLYVFVGPQFKSICPAQGNTKVFELVEEAADWLRANPLKSHKVLVKGSRGIAMERLIDHL